MATRSLSVSALTIFAALTLAAATGCTAEPSTQEGEADQTASELRIRFGAKGDACTVREGVPGTENDSGECCSTADPKDCVIILKPFPTGAMYFAR
jgi:hypothetical protein